MFDRVIAGLLCSLPLFAHAVPTVEIVSPNDGTCVNNGEGLLAGRPLGAERFITINDTELLLRFAEDEGQNLDVEILVDNNPDDEDPPVVAEETSYRPIFNNLPPNVPYDVESNLFNVPADALEEGEGRRIIVRVTNANDEQAEDSITVRVDRKVPVITLPDDQAQELGNCRPLVMNGDLRIDGPLRAEDFIISISDEQDDVPVSEVREENDGCALRVVVLAQDACGNGQEVNLVTLDAAPAASLVFDGVEDGEIATSASPFFRVVTPSNCTQFSQGEFSVDGGPNQILVNGHKQESPGEYEVTARAVVCGIGELEETISFTIVPQPSLDIGGPYEAVQGELLTLDASDSVVHQALAPEWAWDTNGDQRYTDEEGDATTTEFDTSIGDGTYDIGVRLFFNDGDRQGVLFDFATVTLTDIDPICNAGGPYEIGEGLPLTLDASASAPGHDSDPIIAYIWDFGDDQFPQAGPNRTQPVHVYSDQTADGEPFIVTLRINDPDSTVECETTVTVTDVDPVVDNPGILNIGDLYEGDLVRFDAGFTAPGSGTDPITAYEWTFGDGNAAGPEQVLRRPTNVYADQGGYEICLTVNDEDSSAEGCFDITVLDLDPTAIVEGPNVAFEGELLTYDASLSRAGGAADLITRYVWTVLRAGEEPIVYEDPDNPLVRFEYTVLDSREHTIQLEVFDEDSSDVFEIELFVTDVTPRVECSGRVLGREGEPVTYEVCEVEAGAPTDPIVLISYDFGDGERLDGLPPAEQAHTYGNDGVYNTTITARDADGSPVTRSVQVIIDNVDPIVSIEHHTGLPQPDGRCVAVLGDPVAFTVHIEDVPADVPSVMWEFEDDGAQIRDQQEIEHTFRALGTFNVSILVTDGDGGIVTEEVDCEIQRAAPTIEAPEVVDAAEGEPLEINVLVRAAPLAGENVDGPVNVVVENMPRGMTNEIIGVDPREITLRWTPTFVDAGEYTIRISARAPSDIATSRSFTIAVTDRGDPVLAATEGSPANGNVRIFRYEFDNFLRRDVLQRWASIDVGFGAAGLAADPERGRLYVATPGSGGVAVIALDRGDTAERVRTIPTGQGTHGVALGQQRLWAAAAHVGHLVAIDVDTLKVDRRVTVAPVLAPIDLVWLPADFGGLNGAHVAVVGHQQGAIALVDAEAIIDAEDRVHDEDIDAVVTSRVLGGRPQRIAADPASGTLYVADVERRRVWRLATSANLPDAAPPVVLDHAPLDIAILDGELWVATTAGLARVDGDGRVSMYDDIIGRAVAAVPAAILQDSGVVAAGGAEVVHVDAVAGPLDLSALAIRARRLVAFVAQSARN